ncbi:hypothetical protein AGLY_000816 [Aphis glycines]|uniref:Uncharacterized protein n=1 Tax=Aphis glycines TaxID=307491 RepID=A0A6G0U8J8_APHGL|nr:hypothetical protein AGLY_000816 [Aphis glycines]
MSTNILSNTPTSMIYNKYNKAQISGVMDQHFPWLVFYNKWINWYTQERKNSKLSLLLGKSLNQNLQDYSPLSNRLDFDYYLLKSYRSVKYLPNGGDAQNFNGVGLVDISPCTSSSDEPDQLTAIVFPQPASLADRQRLRANDATEFSGTPQEFASSGSGVGKAESKKYGEGPGVATLLRPLLEDRLISDKCSKLVLSVKPFISKNKTNLKFSNDSGTPCFVLLGSLSGLCSSSDSVPESWSTVFN